MSYEEIVIGNSVEAAMLSIQKNCPLILCEERNYTIREYLAPEVDLGAYYFENDTTILNTNYGKLKIGCHLRYLLPRLLFYQSLQGNLFRGIAQFRNDNSLSFSSKAGFNRIFESEQFLVVDIEGMNFKGNVEVIDREFVVYDYIFSRMYSHTYDLLFSGYRKFIQEMWLPEAFGGESHDHEKDIIAVSFLTRDEVYSPDYSDKIMRMMVEEVLEKEGLSWRNELEYYDRKVVEKLKYRCIDTDKIKFMNDIKLEDIIDNDIDKRSAKFMELLMDRKTW